MSVLEDGDGAGGTVQMVVELSEDSMVAGRA